ncbi:MAG: hypothetical protein M1828_004784 [Chrysothrix sp. TS-e1954]|nr:MAG: hypothetical protein M1828_004784 [Chrysothrix sp. TS-e1954]
MAPALRIDGERFRDRSAREITIRGINVAGDAKNPKSPDLPSHVADRFFDGDNVSFVDRPFSLEEAPSHFARLRRWGYTMIRYIFTWEAIEAAGPEKYDEEWIRFTIDVLRVAKKFHFLIFMDPHQDVWSRFTGGSGAPMWTLYACGLNPKSLDQCEAALVQNILSDPASFPKMIWATNYNRLACQVLFTLFFAGRQFAPKAIIDGENIQDYLQGHFIAACKHLAMRIKQAGDLHDECVIGWESMNEPNRGLIGSQDISIHPPEQKLHKGTSPTAWQAMLTGSARACEVEFWDIGGMGPYKSGSQLVDPKGQSAWLPSNFDDKRYGWKRDPGWELGRCIWAQHGVWEPKSDSLLKPNYFSRDPDTGQVIDYEYFTNNFFVAYFRRYRDAIRNVFPGTIMFCQPPVLEIPPSLKGTEDDDPNMVYAPHWYDGLTLMTKKWNRLWNVDVFGVLRGKYLSPAFAIKLGESAIRNCFRDQLNAIQDEGRQYMGTHPCVFTETGVPFDMEDGKAYKTGDYSSQTSALDAVHYGLERSMVGFTLWNYTATNCHNWGDQWNGEDLSIYSLDDMTLPKSGHSRTGSVNSQDPSSPSYTESDRAEDPLLAKSKMTTSNRDKRRSDGKGLRAAQAVVRPTPVATHGAVLSYGFNLAKCEFELKLTTETSAIEDPPTEIFLPEYHFPESKIEVQVSSGRYEIYTDDIELGSSQRLRWWHEDGDQSLNIKGIVHKDETLADSQGILDQCRDKGCFVM